MGAPCSKEQAFRDLRATLLRVLARQDREAEEARERERKAAS